MVTPGNARAQERYTWKLDIIKQIDSAFPGAEFQLLREIAGDIKFFGDYGAHPSDDGIDKVSDEEAKEMLDFSESVLDYVYVQSDKIKKLIINLSLLCCGKFNLLVTSIVQCLNH